MAKKVRVTAQQYADQWAQRLKGSTQRITDGVDRVTESPGARAAANTDKWYQAITSERTRRKWQQSMQALTLDDWKAAMKNKGIGRISAGVDAAKPRMVEVGQRLIEHQNALLGQIDTMPDLTLEDSVNRMVAWVRGMTEFST